MGQCREIRCEDIAATVARLCVQACTLLPEPVRELLEGVCETEPFPPARETLQRYLEILIGEEDSFRRSQETRLKLETIIVRMAYLEPVIPLGEIISTIENIEQKLQQGVRPGARNGEGRLRHDLPANKKKNVFVKIFLEFDYQVFKTENC